MSEKTYPSPRIQILLTAANLLSVVLVTLDSTIAVIALGRIQSTLAASPEQITWVLTSYMIAAAVMTPLGGWLADRFGRIRVMEVSVLCFIVTSAGCGMAPNLELLVLFRFLQGLAGASLVPLSQVLMLDIFPPEKHGPAVAAFGIGTLTGTMLGPTLGAWIIEYTSWRWIFLINVPIGLVSLVGFALFAPTREKPIAHRFDLMGFVLISAALTCMQLVLDRGALLDWFSSNEVVIEAALTVLFAYLALVHIFTVPNPFIKPVIFADRNFTLGTIMSAIVGVFMMGASPLITTMMQQLMGYPVITTGLVSLPRAIGNIMTMVIAGQLVGRMDPRIVITTGMACMIAGYYLLAGVDTNTTQATISAILFLQGMGSGFLFLPLTITVFTTLPEKYKNEGATLFSLTRNVGGAVGVSIIQIFTLHETEVARSGLIENVRPDNPVLNWRLPDFDLDSPATVAMELGQVARQASLIAHTDAFILLLILAAAVVPLCLAMRIVKPEPGQAKPMMIVD